MIQLSPNKDNLRVKDRKKKVQRKNIFEEPNNPKLNQQNSLTM